MPFRASAIDWLTSSECGSDVRVALTGLVESVLSVTYAVTATTQLLLLPADLFALVVHHETMNPVDNSRSGHTLLNVASLRTRSLPFRLSRQGHAVIALLSPCGLLAAFGSRIDACDVVLPLEVLAGRGPVRDLSARLSSVPSTQHAATLGSWLHECVQAGRARTPEGAARAADCAARMVVDGPLPRTVIDLVREASIHRRQLERDFRDWFGVSPGVYLRLARFQWAARQLTLGTPLGDVAKMTHFSDQAHMTRVFKSMSAITPGSLLRHGGLTELQGLHRAARRVLLIGAGVPQLR